LTRNGFVDIQVNGILGTDFGADGLTLEAARQAARELIRRGTVAFCPTVVTASEDTYRRVLPVLADLMDDPEVGGHVAGIHLEGPFISPVPGPRGAHQERFVRPPSIELFDRMMEWARGRVAILTVAPEVPGALELIRHVSSLGVVAAVGHHNADGDTLQAALDAGARLATHVGNGISAQIDRHNNPIWWQLACDDLFCSFITDGHHLPGPFIKTALRAKTPERAIIISDAVMLAGCPPGVYDFSAPRWSLRTAEGCSSGTPATWPVPHPPCSSAWIIWPRWDCSGKRTCGRLGAPTLCLCSGKARKTSPGCPARRWPSGTAGSCCRKTASQDERSLKLSGRHY